MRIFSREALWIAMTGVTLLVILGFFAIAGIVNEEGPAGAEVALSDGWHYRWQRVSADTDLKKDSLCAPETGGWKESLRPYDPPGRTEGAVLCLKKTLPETPVAHPALFLPLVLERFDLFIDGIPVYAFPPEEGIAGQGFAGWPWHSVPLPEKYEGRVMTLRIRSSHMKTGIMGMPYIASADRHIARIVKINADKFVLGFIYIFLGTSLFFIFYRSSRLYNQAEIFSLALFSTLMGIFSISKAGSDVKQLILDRPVFWSTAELVSLYFMPPALLQYLRQIMNNRKVLRLLNAAHLCYAVTALAAVAAGMVHFSRTILPFQVIFLLSIVITVAILMISIRRDSPDTIIIAAGVAVLAVLGSFDILLAMGVLDYKVTFSHIGIFVFILGLYLVMARRITEITTRIQKNSLELEAANVELNRYKESLERLVKERTGELDDSLNRLSGLNAELERLSITDELSGLFNRRCLERRLEEEWRRLARTNEPLTLIMIDIDMFKSYNDEYGHREGDTVITMVGRLLSSSIKRAGEFAARYGGEEFIVVLPGTDIEGARVLAEEIRAAVEAVHDGHSGLLKRPVTISLGVHGEVPTGKEGIDGLVRRADDALYLAKKKGRNRVEIYGPTSKG